MIQTNRKENETRMKAAFVFALILAVIPSAIFIIVQFAPPVAGASSAGPAADNGTDTGKISAATRRARRAEIRTARQEAKTTHTATIPHDAVPDPDPSRFDDDRMPEGNVEVVGAINPYATRSKQATPYPPGTVPGDSGVVVQYAGSPDDMGDAPRPPDDPWNGGVIQARPGMGIGGVRRIDPDDPFFQQEIPNPFTGR